MRLEAFSFRIPYHILNKKSSQIVLYISINEYYVISIDRIISTDSSNTSITPTIKYDLTYMDSAKLKAFVEEERKMLRNDEKIRKAKEVFNKIEEEVLFLSTFKKEIQDNTRVEYKLIESIEKKYYDMIDSSNHMFDISYMNQFQKEFDERMVGVKYLLKKYIK